MAPWTIVFQAPMSIGFSRQEYWSGLSFPSSRDLPDPRSGTWVNCIVGRVFIKEPLDFGRTQFSITQAHVVACVGESGG